MHARVFRVLLVVSTVCALSAAGCTGLRSEHLTFSGRSYSAIGIPGLKVVEADVTPLGNVASLDAGEITDHTAYRLRGVDSTDAIVLRRDDGTWVVFSARVFTEIGSLCSYYDPAPSYCP